VAAVVLVGRVGIMTNKIRQTLMDLIVLQVLEQMGG
jgi:hypothetical protein